MNSGVYQILNTANQHRYIGSAANFHRRFTRHIRHLELGAHHCQPLQRAWIKYGASAFQFQPVMLCEIAGVLPWEQKYLDEFKPEYNVALNVHAPMTGRKRTAESRARMSAIMIGKNVGKKHPPRTREHIAKLPQCQKGCKGRAISLAQRAQISKCHLGRKRSPETRARLSAAAFARYGNTTGIRKYP